MGNINSNFQKKTLPYLVTELLLLNKEESFSESLNLYFPNYYDIKAVIQDLNINLKGTLSRIASDLGVRRVGNTHQGGSDSLVTSKVFFQLIAQYAEQIDLMIYKNKLFGFNNLIIDEYGQNSGNYNYYVNNSMNMYPNKVANNNFKGSNINSNVYFPNNNGNNFNNFNNIWNGQGGYNNMYGYENSNNNVNPYYQQSGIGEMYINNNSNNIGYSLPVNLKNNGSGGSKDAKLFDPKSK